MSPEEYQRIKEEEKAHLRKLKELKQRLRGLQRQNRLRQAVEGITTESRAMLDENEALVEQLAFEAARQEARIEMALESQPPEEDAASPPDAEALDEEMVKARAQTLLRQIRQQMGVPDAESAADAATPADAAARPPEAPEAASENPTPSEAPPEAPPEKTIGRMR